MFRIALKFGIILAVGLTSFFLVMHYLGFSDNYNLRIFNGIIHLSVIYYAIKTGMVEGEVSGGNYISAVFMGMVSSFIGVAAFAFFQLVFLYLDPAFMAQIQASFEIGRYLNPFTASLIILVEGVVVSLIGSYIIARILEMQMAQAQKEPRL